MTKNQDSEILSARVVRMPFENVDSITVHKQNEAARRSLIIQAFESGWFDHLFKIVCTHNEWGDQVIFYNLYRRDIK